jgi:hypothetical protein
MSLARLCNEIATIDPMLAEKWRERGVKPVALISRFIQRSAVSN